MKNTTEIQAALEATLAELKPLRDRMLAQGDRSQAALFLGQLTLLFQRISHGIPITADDFGSLLWAAGLVEENPARAMVEGA